MNSLHLKRPKGWYEWLYREVNKEAGYISEYERPLKHYKRTEVKEPLATGWINFLKSLRV